MKTNLLSAKGAVSVPASGNACGLMESARASAESANHFGITGLNPASSAHFLNNAIPGEAFQAKADVFALALSTSLRIDGASYKPHQSAAFHTRSKNAP